MPDITMCTDRMCPMYRRCYRAQAIPNPYRQSYFANRKWDNGCEHYIPMTEKEIGETQRAKDEMLGKDD